MLLPRGVGAQPALLLLIRGVEYDPLAVLGTSDRTRRRWGAECRDHPPEPESRGFDLLPEKVLTFLWFCTAKRLAAAARLITHGLRSNLEWHKTDAELAAEAGVDVRLIAEARWRLARAGFGSIEVDFRRLDDRRTIKRSTFVTDRAAVERGLWPKFFPRRRLRSAAKNATPTTKRTNTLERPAVSGARQRSVVRRCAPGGNPFRPDPGPDASRQAVLELFRSSPFWRELRGLPPRKQVRRVLALVGYGQHARPGAVVPERLRHLESPWSADRLSRALTERYGDRAPLILERVVCDIVLDPSVRRVGAVLASRAVALLEGPSKAMSYERRGASHAELLAALPAPESLRVFPKTQLDDAGVARLQAERAAAYQREQADDAARLERSKWDIGRVLSPGRGILAHERAEERRRQREAERVARDGLESVDLSEQGLTREEREWRQREATQRRLAASKAEPVESDDPTPAKPTDDPFQALLRSMGDGGLADFDRDRRRKGHRR